MNGREFTTEETIDSCDDLSLHESTFQSGRYPILYLTAKDLPGEVILDAIQENLLPYDKNDVAIIIDFIKDKQTLEKYQRIEAFCKTRSWKLILSNSMNGIEASVIVLYFLHNENRAFEYHTRARNLLIIFEE